MAVNGVNSNTVYLDDIQRKPKSILGKDDFLILLMKQMQYQDPLNPMDNNQYIAQMAQLSSVEQLTNMAQSITTSQAYSLMGKNVKASIIDEQGMSKEITGKVEKVLINGSNISLTVDGTAVSLSNITEVMNEDAATTS